MANWNKLSPAERLAKLGRLEMQKRENPEYGKDAAKKNTLKQRMENAKKKSVEEPFEDPNPILTPEESMEAQKVSREKTAAKEAAHAEREKSDTPTPGGPKDSESLKEKMAKANRDLNQEVGTNKFTVGAEKKPSFEVPLGAKKEAVKQQNAAGHTPQNARKEEAIKGFSGEVSGARKSAGQYKQTAFGQETAMKYGQVINPPSWSKLPAYQIGFNDVNGEPVITPLELEHVILPFLRSDETNPPKKNGWGRVFSARDIPAIASWMRKNGKLDPVMGEDRVKDHSAASKEEGPGAEAGFTMKGDDIKDIPDAKGPVRVGGSNPGVKKAPTIEEQFAAQHPEIPPEQIEKALMDRLARLSGLSPLGKGGGRVKVKEADELKGTPAEYEDKMGAEYSVDDILNEALGVHSKMVREGTGLTPEQRRERAAEELAAIEAQGNPTRYATQEQEAKQAGFSKKAKGTKKSGQSLRIPDAERRQGQGYTFGHGQRALDKERAKEEARIKSKELGVDEDFYLKMKAAGIV